MALRRSELDSPLSPGKPTAGIQFVKPRIYQTGGGEWKSVNYENPEDLSLKQKLKMLGIDHEEGTKEYFHCLARLKKWASESLNGVFLRSLW